MVKLIAIDLDGTLFDDEKNISEENLKAIDNAQKLGCKVVIASGRPLCGIMPTLEKLKLTKASDYVICYNGALVLNVKTGEVIFSKTLTGVDLAKIYSLAKLLNVNIHAYREKESLITPKLNPYTAVTERVNNIKANLCDFNSIASSEKFIKIMLIDDELRLNYIEDNLDKQYFDAYSIVRSSKIYLEFLNKETDKGLALKALANYLNIDLKDTMAIGDAGNDLNMILLAGIGVAMGNSFAYVKSSADYVTLDNKNSGVANAINKFVLN